MEDCIMSFLSWLFGLGKHSRYSKHGRYSGHGGYSKHGRQHEYQNRDSYSDVNQQYQNIMRCKQCNSILNKEAKFCSECGLPV